MLFLTIIYIITDTVILSIQLGSYYRRKLPMIVGLVVSALMAVCAAIFLIGGELLWVSFVMALPVPDGLKCILWGWY